MFPLEQFVIPHVYGYWVWEPDECVEVLTALFGAVFFDDNVLDSFGRIFSGTVDPVFRDTHTAVEIAQLFEISSDMAASANPCRRFDRIGQCNPCALMLGVFAEGHGRAPLPREPFRVFECVVEIYNVCRGPYLDRNDLEECCSPEFGDLVKMCFIFCFYI